VECPVTERDSAPATPLAWTHAQFVRLAWSVEAKRPVEQPSIVACRYTGRCTNEENRRW
jgi:glucoamylase